VNEQPRQHSTNAYRTLALEMGIDFAIMYFVMYTMIATTQHLVLNLNNLYMTLMMVAPMAVVMLISMRGMFPDRRRNLVIGATAAAVFVGAFAAMRTQAAIGDAAFLRSMIPHHSGAILMCERSALTDPQVIELCEQIVQSQKDEIAAMQAMLARY
jgi:uncharacterized protein (DUF305 family)